MPSASKVVWSEGMLLRTQHFQQQDRWVERLVGGTLAGAVGHGWGISELALDRLIHPFKVDQQERTLGHKLRCCRWRTRLCRRPAEQEDLRWR
jgi:hypothetical protein